VKKRKDFLLNCEKLPPNCALLVSNGYRHDDGLSAVEIVHLFSVYFMVLSIGEIIERRAAAPV
jgi:hypothetical protein